MEVSRQSNFQAAKDRINTSLDTLRDELRAIHEQDLSLLRHLMHIHHTITLLTGTKTKRSYSSSCLSSLSPAPELPTKADKRNPLSRGQSMPFRTNGRDDDDDDDDEDGDDESDEEDPLSLSLSALSSTSHLSDTLGRSMDDNYQVHGEFAMFYPLPYNLQRSPFFPSQSIEEVSDEDDDDHADVTHAPTNQYPEISQLESRATQNQQGLPEQTHLTQYELSSSTYLKRSSQLWREVQREQEETGTVNERKIATLKVFL